MVPDSKISKVFYQYHMFCILYIVHIINLYLYCILLQHMIL